MNTRDWKLGSFNVRWSPPDENGSFGFKLDRFLNVVVVRAQHKTQVDCIMLDRRMLRMVKPIGARPTFNWVPVRRIDFNALRRASRPPQPGAH